MVWESFLEYRIPAKRPEDPLSRPPLTVLQQQRDERSTHSDRGSVQRMHRLGDSPCAGRYLLDRRLAW